MQDFEQAYAKAKALDAQDPLSAQRDGFQLPEGLIYLDGNSLGALPRSMPARMQEAVENEWGRGLIRSWNDAGWYQATSRVGASIAKLIGAKPNEVMACDSTSINLFKVMSAAAQALPDRKIIICEEGNFPTDGYIGEGAAALFGKQIVLANQENIEEKIAQAGSQLCFVSLTQVHYKTGRMLDMARVTRLVQAQGARMIWDLAHSAGAVVVQLNACRVDYAVGCGYKYLNGGPGAPAFVYVREDLRGSVQQPLQGWFGHASPFAFEQAYTPAQGMSRMLVGTSSVLSMIALEEALKVHEGVSMQAIRAKSEALTQLFIELYDAHIAPLGFGLATPRNAADRGSQVSFTHPDGYAIMQALIARGVIGDFRAPNILRFGFAPLYVSYADVVRSVEILREVMESASWQQPEFQQRKAVT
ncbi:kynureninase [Variovorax sp. PCZ-1]|uniref:kynureninase n=1 Tax=Variovorax sp. PCZ-1 TaxID=2835533 RepID=UPI001BCD8BB1|nr:kynureninase [Variovorax sp. PCZ-1]MBS7806660.1 kynureninase [Variovorax sp. PCZ-1]